jgi:hypothetical protein
MHMHFDTIEWLPTSLCCIDSTDNSFGGSVEATAGGGGPGPDFGGAGGSNFGNGDSSGGGGTGFGTGPGTTGALAAGGSAGMAAASAAAAIAYAAMENPVAAVMALLNAGFNFKSAETLIEYGIGQIYANDPQAVANHSLVGFTQ